MCTRTVYLRRAQLHSSLRQRVHLIALENRVCVRVCTGYLCVFCATILTENNHGNNYHNR